MNQNNRNNTLIHHIEDLLMNCRSKPSGDEERENKEASMLQSKDNLTNSIKESKDIKVIEEALNHLNARNEHKFGSRLEKTEKSWIVKQLNKRLGNLEQPLPDFEAKFGKHGIESNLQHNIVNQSEDNPSFNFEQYGCKIKHSYIDGETGKIQDKIKNGLTKEELKTEMSLLASLDSTRRELPQYSPNLGEELGEHNISLNFKPYIVSINNASINTYMKNKENKGLKR